MGQYLQKSWQFYLFDDGKEEMTLGRMALSSSHGYSNKTREYVIWFQINLTRNTIVPFEISNIEPSNAEICYISENTAGN